MLRSSLISMATLLLIGLIPTADCAAQSPYFQVPPGPRTTVRGHIHIRNGLFHTYRERWGSGITPQGAMLLSNLGYSAAILGAAYVNPAVIPNLPQPSALATGGQDPDDEVRREAMEAEMRAELEQQLVTRNRLNGMQRRANDMLAKLNLPIEHPVDDPGAAPVRRIDDNGHHGRRALPPAGDQPGASQQEPFTGSPEALHPPALR